MQKACSRCGKIHDYTYKCNHGRTHTKHKDTEASRIRRTEKWNKKREQIKEDANYLCEYCLHLGRLTYTRLEIHHITPINTAPELAYTDTNLICLCTTCHKQAEKHNIPQDTLATIAQERTKQ